jgi:hypothetical protein
MKNPTTLNHWSYYIELLGIKPLAKASTFFDLTNNIGLSYYVDIKYKSGIIVDYDVNQHMLTHEISSTWQEIGASPKVPDPILLEQIL